ncbi:type I-E CRISPR-associated protein Cse1/CasA [Actinopolyspora mortivallis]|uniref:Type I-E CRISPR-associated protein Cse1/CasA n=1 Tax=Actinopolyspora mortivallis TaxID=33906 RepID=A0A2T0GSJ8_ACTMO|nr:type I-E CRISPR-associated protein Cse1/CasA [Actinopolyspora mortivallis]PRW62067.1 type I-E CRISPR-associated protein Cse1/CasA [Actinopolyspora mortivallis]
MPTDTGFNLLDEPWITVLDSSGREQQVSILDAFERAPWLGMVDGEVPTQGFAITRLLLAFLHRAVDGPRDQDEWEQLWEAEELPLERIHDYARQVRHRFDLFDTEAPFFQVASLRTAKNEISGLEKIVADVPNGEPYFTSRSAASLRRIDAAEAARWLVHTHAFDPSGIKSGAVGDPKVKGGRGYPIGTGWAGQLGGVLPQGANLRETLLLNLVSRDVETFVRIGGKDDVPPWEREPDGPEHQDDRPPNGAIDLYTWQTRRIRLAGDRDGVTGVLLANGDRIQPQNRQSLDPHTAWRYSEPQSKKFKKTVYMPQTHDPNRSVWRGIAAMLPSISGRRIGSGDSQPYLAPGVLQWLGDLTSEGKLSETYVPRVRVLGAEYGAQSATYSEIIDDVLPLSVVLLRQDSPAAGQTATEAVADAEKVGTAIWSFAENIAQAAGAAPGSGAGDRAREQLYAALESPYRAWLAELGPSTDLAGARAEWQRIVDSATTPITDELVDGAAPAAWNGRTIQNRLVNVAIAEVWFRAALRKALPLARTSSENTALEKAV